MIKKGISLSMGQVQTGLDILISDKTVHPLLKGRVGYLSHSASLTQKLIHGAELLTQLLGDQLACLLGPQHGFVSDVQDNMIETDHFHHPYFNRLVYSLYGKERSPTDSMLDSIDTLIVDLQDVGTRVYTYITTLGLCMQACERKAKRIIVLDRPNPAGPLVEGSPLRSGWESFVGHYPIAQRHGLSMGEIALLQKKLVTKNCDLHVIEMKNYRREMTWSQTMGPWINPSPNLSTPHSCLVFPGTVLFEGTCVSEGRGTTRALEMVGFPGVEPFSLRDRVEEELEAYSIEGVVLQPVFFKPTFHKHQGLSCGGLHIHVTDSRKARTWRLGQLLLKHFKKSLGAQFSWNDKPYEYERDRLAIDIINGGEELRKWVEDGKSGVGQLLQLENQGMDDYLRLREDCLLY